MYGSNLVLGSARCRFGPELCLGSAKCSSHNAEETWCLNHSCSTDRIPEVPVTDSLNEFSDDASREEWDVEDSEDEGSWSSTAPSVEWRDEDLVLEGTPLGRDLDAGVKGARLVSRRMNGDWESVFVVMQSAALRKLGECGLGLYSTKLILGNELIWHTYPGIVVHRTQNIDCPRSRAVIEQLAQDGYDRMRVVVRGVGYSEVIQGEGLPPMWAANTATGLKRGKNVKTAKTGSARAVRAIQPLPPDFQMMKLDELLKHELLTSYGRHFWRIHGRGAMGSARSHHETS